MLIESLWIALKLSKVLSFILKANGSLTQMTTSSNLGRSKLAISCSTEFLGIELDSNVTFKKDVTQVCKKFNYFISLMRTVRPLRWSRTMVKIYHSVLSSFDIRHRVLASTSCLWTWASMYVMKICLKSNGEDITTRPCDISI